MKSISMGALAEAASGRLVGDAGLEISGIAPLREATPVQLGLLAAASYTSHLVDCRAGALLVAASLEAACPEDRPRIVVEDAHAALVPLLHIFYPNKPREPTVHPTAVLGRRVELGNDVYIGPFAVLGDDVVIGDRCVVAAHAVLGDGCRMGADSEVHPHVVLYRNTSLGRRVVIHAGTALGVDGFGYALVGGRFEKVPQVGSCTVGDDVEIGANACIDRGSIGETRIGRGTKLDNHVHLAHNVHVGEDCAMAAQVGISGSTRIGNHTVFGGQAGTVGHLEIGEGAQISSGTGVIGDVPPGGAMLGFPARDHRSFLRSFALFMKLPQIVKRLSKVEKRLSADKT